MHTIFESTGTLRALTDFNGDPIGHDIIRDVVAVASYELKPSPAQSFVVDIFGMDITSGAGQWTEELVLENGLILKGKCGGGGPWRRGEPPKIRKMQMYDVSVENEPPAARSKIILNPRDRTSPKSNEIDSAVFGVVSSNPLGHGGCTNGVARPGFPFSFRKTFPADDKLRGAWSTAALRLSYADLEVIFVETSNYWKSVVDSKNLFHDMVVGVRRTDRARLSWDEFADVTDLLTHFIGWLGHCVSPIYHVKGYRKGKLVYRAYDLYPHPTVHRERFSWLPALKENRDEDQTIPVQSLFDGFVATWKQNVQEKGTFHIALQLLRSREKGSPLGRPAIGYLRDTFTACAILESILTGQSSNSGRPAQIARCLKEISMEDKLPHLDQSELDEVAQNHQLWRASNTGIVQTQEQASRTLSRPLANVENWLLHIDDPGNSKRLLTLPAGLQHYLLEVSIWLADLMVLKVVGYEGHYANRLARTVDRVPWATP